MSRSSGTPRAAVQAFPLDAGAEGDFAPALMAQPQVGESGSVSELRHVLHREGRVDARLQDEVLHDPPVAVGLDNRVGLVARPAQERPRQSSELAGPSSRR